MGAIIDAKLKKKTEKGMPKLMLQFDAVKRLETCTELRQWGQMLPAWIRGRGGGTTGPLIPRSEGDQGEPTGRTLTAC